MLRIFVEQTAWHRPLQPGRTSAAAGDQRASRSSLLLSLASHPASKGRAVPWWRKQAAHRLRGSSFCAPVPSRAWHLGYWNKRKAQLHSCLSRWETNPCVPLIRGQVGGLRWPFSMGWWCTPVGFRTPIPAATTLLSLSYTICCSATNTVSVRCPLHRTLFPIFVPLSLSESIFPCKNNPCLFPFSRCLSRLSFGWSRGGWK